MEKEILEQGKKLVEKNLIELFKKPDINGQETTNAKNGFELLDILNCEIEECKAKEDMDKEYSERGYSRHGYESMATPRRYNITSYRGMHPTSVVSYNDGYSQGYRDGSYDSGRRDYSGDYGVQGWYRSGNEPYYPHDYAMTRHGSVSMMSDPYARGYSGHSISDRLVAEAERMMDRTESNYEREELRKYIRMIRSAAMAE